MVMTNKKMQARKRAKIRQNPIKHSVIKDKVKLQGWHFTRIKLDLPNPVGNTRLKPGIIRF